MAQGTAKSVLIYGTLAAALFATCEICATKDTGNTAAALTPVSKKPSADQSPHARGAEHSSQGMISDRMRWDGVGKEVQTPSTIQ